MYWPPKGVHMYGIIVSIYVYFICALIDIYVYQEEHTMYTYYRAMSKNEATELDVNDEQYATNLNTKTYWTNSYTAAANYCSEGRVIAVVVLDRDIPSAYHSIAMGVDDEGYINNHHEVVMTRGQMNDQLINALEAEVVEY